MSPYTAILAFVLHQSVYVCPGDDGAPLFTDRPCPEGIEQRLDAGSVVAPLPLTADEQRTLDGLARRPVARGDRSRRDAVATKERVADCRRVEAALADLRETRRRGYRVKDAAALDARERALRARRDACP